MVIDRLPRIVDAPAALRTLVHEIAAAPLLAVDTESNAFHAYRTRVCLVQIADRSGEWAVDPLALDDLSPLAELLNRPSVTKILHAAEGDILVLRRNAGFGIAPVFDTMLAARILGHKRFGLADLLAHYFDVHLDKKYQRHDWALRPIEPAALRYAAADVRYLSDLHDRLRSELHAAGRLEEAQEEFRRIEAVQPEERPFDREGFWRIKGARDLPPRSRAVLRALYEFRDARARSLDRPAFRVINDDALLSIAGALPVDAVGLRRSGLTPVQVDRYGRGVLEAVRSGLRERPPEPPRGGPPPDPREIARYDALRAWRREVAEARGVDPDVVVSNATLRALAQTGPVPADGIARAGSLGPWKASVYADDLARVLRAVG